MYWLHHISHLLVTFPREFFFFFFLTWRKFKPHTQGCEWVAGARGHSLLGQRWQPCPCCSSLENFQPPLNTEWLCLTPKDSSWAGGGGDVTEMDGMWLRWMGCDKPRGTHCAGLLHGEEVLARAPGLQPQPFHPFISKAWQGEQKGLAHRRV